MRVLVVDDEANIRKTTVLALEALGHDAAMAATAEQAKQAVRAEAYDICFLDLKIGTVDGLEVLPELLEIRPALRVVMFTAFATIRSAVDAVRLGAVDFIPKPFTREQIDQTLRRIEREGRLERKAAQLEADIAEALPDLETSFRDPAVRKVSEVLGKAAPTSATILILGPSGTGKTVLARTVHRASDRKDAPFVTLNCPSLSRELLESELFGHVRGAFTGAVSDTTGKAAIADGGTLFLDEIGELPLEIQPKLLRLLQEREYERVGETRTRQADVRVIAATNRDLEQAVRDGRFREDLFFRLNVISVALPPLRERPEDLEPLARHFLDFFTRRMGKPVKDFHPDALAAFRRYSWPGNLRELGNVIERAVILSAGDRIEPDDLPENLVGTAEPGLAVGAPVTLAELEEHHLRRVMAASSSMEEAARTLGIDPATLYRKRQRLGLR